jgi:hypothetical protein
VTLAETGLIAVTCALDLATDADEASTTWQLTAVRVTQPPPP